MSARTAPLHKPDELDFIGCDDQTGIVVFQTTAATTPRASTPPPSTPPPARASTTARARSAGVAAGTPITSRPLGCGPA